MRIFSGPLAMIRKAGALIGRRGHINFSDTASVTWTIADDSANDEIDISAVASGAGVTFAAPSAAIDIGDTAVEGVAATALRSDAQFAFPAPAVGYPVDADFSAEADGVATTPARSDHRHAVTAPAAVEASAPGDVGAVGTSNPPARGDHRHGREAFGAAGYPADVAAAEADGVATTLPRSDHAHAHGSGYLANAHHAQAHDIDGADHALAGEVAGEFMRATSATAFAFEVVPFSRGGTILDPTAARFVMVWRAPFACTVTNVRGHRKGGTGATVNARRNQLSDHLAGDLSLTTADAWTDGGAVQNTAYAAGDDLEIEIASLTGTVTEIAIQVDLSRP